MNNPTILDLLYEAHQSAVEAEALNLTANGGIREDHGERWRTTSSTRLRIERAIKRIGGTVPRP